MNSFHVMTAACFAVGTLAATSAANPTLAIVDQVGLRFTLLNANVAVGGAAQFHNSDDVIHNIMTIDEEDLPEDHGLQKPGEVITASFDRAGTYQVRCSIHPKMKMTIKVGK